MSSNPKQLTCVTYMQNGLPPFQIEKHNPLPSDQHRTEHLVLENQHLVYFIHLRLLSFLFPLHESLSRRITHQIKLKLFLIK